MRKLDPDDSAFAVQKMKYPLEDLFAISELDEVFYDYLHLGKEFEQVNPIYVGILLRTKPLYAESFFKTMEGYEKFAGNNLLARIRLAEMYQYVYKHPYYSLALKYASDAAYKGSAKGQFLYGRLVEKENPSLAMQMFSESSDQGFPFATCALGTMRSRENPLTLEDKKYCEEKWMKAGTGKSVTELYVLWLRDGVIDRSKAASKFLELSRMDYPYYGVYRMLGDIYQDPLYGGHDAETAARYYRTGADLGDRMCLESLARMYRAGAIRGPESEAYWMEQIMRWDETRRTLLVERDYKEPTKPRVSEKMAEPDNGTSSSGTVSAASSPGRKNNSFLWGILLIILLVVLFIRHCI